MKITKIFHSCILIEEKVFTEQKGVTKKNTVKILIDPGTWVFGEKWAQPEDFADVDIVLVTHEHQDHYDPQALKIICKNGARLITNTSLSVKMKVEGLPSEVLMPGKTITIKSISIRGTKSPHAILPLPVPENLGFVVQEKIYHPGDSLDTDTVKSIDVLLIPITAPWMRLAEGVELTQKIKPRIAVPIHDGFMKYPFALNMFDKVISEAGILVLAKLPGEFVEI